MAAQIRVQDATDEELLEICRKETGSVEFHPLTWDNPPNDVRKDPSKDTVAVIVDVRGRQGAINIGMKKDNDYVDKIGPLKGAANLVIVLWEYKWWYYAIGSVGVAHVRKKS